MSIEQFTREAVRNVMHFESSTETQVIDALCDKKSVVVLTKLYQGNGKWKLDKNRYKMLVPLVDNRGNLYSTDVFKNVTGAIHGRYEIYRVTRQEAIDTVCMLNVDVNPERFGFGYTEEKYGRKTIEQYLETL